MKQELHLVVHSKGRAAALQNEPTSEVTDAKEDKRLALTTSDQKIYQKCTVRVNLGYLLVKQQRCVLPAVQVFYCEKGKNEHCLCYFIVFRSTGATFYPQQQNL